MEQRRRVVGHPEVTTDITEQELLRRKDFLEFRDEDVTYLIGITDLAQRYGESVIEDFYKHLLSFEETKVFFSRPRGARAYQERSPAVFSSPGTGQFGVVRRSNDRLE